MTLLLAQIAPQRSTQYADLAAALAPQELALSRLGSRLTATEPVVLGGQRYLRLSLAAPLDQQDLYEIGTLASISACFTLYEHLGGIEGPFLRPIETNFAPAFPPDIVLTRRYKGKTNELFTHFLCNIARFSSAWANEPWDRLRIFDPLAGGGTTLFTALVLGGEAAGVERNAADVQSTTTFITQYCRDQGIRCAVLEERLRKFGTRWTFTIGKTDLRRLVLARGDTADSAAFVAGFKPHLVVTDLPYGLQHHGELLSLLHAALPVWTTLVPPGGALAFSWDATRFRREAMVDLVEASAPLSVLDEPPYTNLGHRVDRAIRERDVIVARPTS
jgi:hypothetical protein